MKKRNVLTFALAISLFAGINCVNAEDLATYLTTNEANKTYTMTETEVVSGSLADINGNSLTINGNDNILDGNFQEGFNINDVQVLTINDVSNLYGFKDNVAITNNGRVVLSNTVVNDEIKNDSLAILELSNVTLNKKVSGGNISVSDLVTINKNLFEVSSLDVKNGTIKLGEDFDDLSILQTSFENSTLDTQNNMIEGLYFNELVLNSDLNLKLDANFEEEMMDTIDVQTFTSNGYNINISDIKILAPTTKEKFSISPLGSPYNLIQNAELAYLIQYTGGDLIYSPIYKYSAQYDRNTGIFNFTRLAQGGDNNYNTLNPGIMAPAVAAQLGGYLTQLNSYNEAFRNMDMYMLMTSSQRQAMKFRNKYASASGSLMHDPKISQYENKAGWFRPFATFEKVNLDNGPKVSNVAYGSYFGGDSELYDLGKGWDGMWSVYAGYNGSHQSYDGVSIYQNGGTLGATGMLYKSNFFTGLTANVGASSAEASSMFGNDNFTLLMSGVASKSGYNFELADGKFIIQPNMLLAYSFVHTFDYTTDAGVSMNSDPLHAITLEPGVKFIGNLKNGWQPYAGVSVVWNIMDKTHFSAADVQLPSLSVDPYVKYGVGVRKSWGERFTGFFQTFVTNGGRNGVGLQAGFRWALGEEPSKVAQKLNQNIPQRKAPEIVLNNIK